MATVTADSAWHLPYQNRKYIVQQRIMKSNMDLKQVKIQFSCPGIQWGIGTGEDRR